MHLVILILEFLQPFPELFSFLFSSEQLLCFVSRVFGNGGSIDLTDSGRLIEAVVATQTGWASTFLFSCVRFCKGGIFFSEAGISATPTHKPPICDGQPNPPAEKNEKGRGRFFFGSKTDFFPTLYMTDRQQRFHF